MNVPELLFVIALIVAVVDEVRARGESLAGWAVICIAIGLLWGKLG